MKILVVDDEKTLVKGIKFNLENEGYQVECAYDGAAAVELARNEKFDLLILDVMMPKLDGISVLKAMRAKGMRVPVLMLTAIPISSLNRNYRSVSFTKDFKEAFEKVRRNAQDASPFV